jgi:hypothetical protein
MTKNKQGIHDKEQARNNKSNAKGIHRQKVTKRNPQTKSHKKESTDKEQARNP